MGFTSRSSPDTAPSHFYMFRALKNAICNTKFETDVVVFRALRTWLREQDEEWHQQAIHTHNCSSLVQDRRSGGRRCGKIEYRGEPSHLLMGSLHYLGINIY